MLLYKPHVITQAQPSTGAEMSVRHFSTSADMSGQFGSAEVSYGHFGTSAEVSYGHFGTSAEMSWVQSVLGPKCLDTLLISDYVSCICLFSCELDCCSTVA